VNCQNPKCGAAFVPSRAGVKYCSKQCNDVAQHIRQAAERREARRAARPQGLPCKTCGGPIVGRRPQAIFCSRPCAVKEPPKPRVVRAAPLPKPAPAPKPKKQPKASANLSGGPWFPGWNGCYAPSLTPSDIELIERVFGPPSGRFPQWNDDAVIEAKRPRHHVGIERTCLKCGERFQVKDYKLGQIYCSQVCGRVPPSAPLRARPAPCDGPTSPPT
jgi:hypothetical protein